MSTTNAPAVVDSLDDLFTAAELARRLKVKPSYLRWLRHRHGLPYVRVGGEVRFNWAAVSVWLEARAKAQGGTPGTDASALSARLAARLGHDPMAALRKHVVALARDRGNGTGALEAALKEVQELGAQKVLLAAFIAAQMLNAAGATRAEDKSPDDQVRGLFDIVLLKVERALERFANGELKWGVRSPAGDPNWGRQAAEGAAALMATVVALRGHFANKGDEGTAATAAGKP